MCALSTSCASRERARADLDLVFDALLNGRVPPLWLKTYPSLKPLGAWTRDLLARVDQLARWVEDTYPPTYWLSGFTYPTGFLTAVLQTTARRSAVPIDTLSFEFGIVHLDPSEIAAPPKEGVYVHGMFLEGAGWDFEEVRISNVQQPRQQCSTTSLRPFRSLVRVRSPTGSSVHAN